MNLLNFYECALNYPKNFTEPLRKAARELTPRTRDDKWVPKEELVLESIKLMHDLAKDKRDRKYLALYHAVLDSASRPEHVAEALFENFKPELLEEADGFYKYRANIERGTKHCWVIYLTPYTARLLMELHERGEVLTFEGWKSWIRRRPCGVTKRLDGKVESLPLRLKWIRKFAMNMMRKVGLERDVVQFLAGEKPQGVDAEHYIDLEGLADEKYPDYAKYVEELRRRALED